MPELLAPSGNWECARAAVANGADAIYFGLPAFNARMRADNFTAGELPELMAFLHEHGTRGYATFNTLIFTDELEAAAGQLRHIAESGVDAVIVQDLGLARMVRKLTPGLHLHASTQMTITSPEGLALIEETLQPEKAVIARENSLREMTLFRSDHATNHVPLETFVHGALCVAYSGQCLTSESLGQRSANRGECAQACRMTYELIVDGKTRDLGDKKYLLSPQDLAGADLIPQLIEHGIQCFKIEGRLKSPEYVAAITRAYRKAIDEALAGRFESTSNRDRYEMEMAFSRGLHTGWLEGINNKQLVHARFGKKRGALIGSISEVGKDWISVKSPQVPLKNGDGIVIETGEDTNREQGGRIFGIRGDRILLQRGKLDLNRVLPGHRLWKTDDPALTRDLRQTWKGNLDHRKIRVSLHWKVTGKAGFPMTLSDLGTGESVASPDKLQFADKRPLTDDLLNRKLGRLGNTSFTLCQLDTKDLENGLILPVSQLNQMRRELLKKIQNRLPDTEKPPEAVAPVGLDELLPDPGERVNPAGIPPTMRVLCRTEEQVDAAMACGVSTLYLDLEDVRRFRHVVPRIRRSSPDTRIFVATPRIQKPGETGLFRLVAKAEPDGVLVRNLGGVHWFRSTDLAMAGDFSLNVANPISAQFFRKQGLESLTVSYDLNIGQAIALLQSSPTDWFEVTLHQHMPMFHMEHCVFCSFLSDGTDVTNCGRPCDQHEVRLRDRVGQEHILKADVGCRNTLFNGRTQSGARYFGALRAAGMGCFRVELLDEDYDEAIRVIECYDQLAREEKNGDQLWKLLQFESRLGVVEGTMEVKE